MDDIKHTLMELENAVRNRNTKIAQNIHETINTMGPSPNIETFAKPIPKVVVKDDEGTIHSFAVEIKSNQDGPIPDTQLMSKILQAIENHNTPEGVEQYAAGERPTFEVVSFKYERREEKRK